eukprot:gene4969-3567_t
MILLKCTCFRFLHSLLLIWKEEASCAYGRRSSNCDVRVEKQTEKKKRTHEKKIEKNVKCASPWEGDLTVSPIWYQLSSSSGSETLTSTFIYAFNHRFDHTLMVSTSPYERHGVRHLRFCSLTAPLLYSLLTHAYTCMCGLSGPPQYCIDCMETRKPRLDMRCVDAWHATDFPGDGGTLSPCQKFSLSA